MVAFTLLVPGAARAACPGIFSDETCDGVCGATATYVECNLDQGGSADASGNFVSPTSTTFRAYGFDDTGNEFCCELAGLDDGCATDEIDVLITGTEDDDDIKLYDVSTGLDLDCSDAEVRGGAGIDNIGGSRLSTNFDFLYGEGGVDVIHGNAGNDFIVGGDGDDLLFGEAGNDTILGGDGDDKIKGGDGADTVEGGNHADQICGSGGDDLLYGEGANDIPFGGGGDDYTAGGDGTDDYCDGETTDALCENTSTSCPW